MLSFDPAGTQVVLIGTTKCPNDPSNLPALPSVANNVAELKAIFTNPAIVGLDDSNLLDIIDPPSTTQLLIKLQDAAEKATDTLLVYYAGHGIKSPLADGLFVATTETTQKHCHLNGVEFNRVRQIIFASPAAKKILIFDCCYSGEILADQMGGADASVVSNSIHIKGVYSIASAPRNSLAYAPSGERFTAFTKELVSVLGDGVDAPTEYITLNRVYDEVRSRIASNPNLPPPQKKVELDLDEFVVAKNTRYALDPEVRLRKLEERYRALLEESRQREDDARRRLGELEAKLSDLGATKSEEAAGLRKAEEQSTACPQESRRKEASALKRVRELEAKIADLGSTNGAAPKAPPSGSKAGTDGTLNKIVTGAGWVFLILVALAFCAQP